jgi:hypothetical protein
MKCPHCGESVGLFSRGMMFGKAKSCPHCQKPVEVFTSYKVAIPLMVLAYFLTQLIRPVFLTFFGRLGVSLGVGLSMGLLVGLAVMLAMRLRAA